MAKKADKTIRKQKSSKSNNDDLPVLNITRRR